MSLETDRRNAPGVQAPPASVALWMPLFIKEHRAEASTLTHIEHSVQCYLIMLLWERDGEIPDDDKWIAKQVRVSAAQWRGMRDTLLQDCEVANGVISHPRLKSEIDKAKANVEQKRKAGIASGAARSGRSKTNGCSTAVERGGQRNANGIEPRAGSGDGDGVGSFPSQPEKGFSLDSDGAPFRVIEGGR